MFGLPSQFIGRGQGDDALFEILDGTGRAAVVHLTWVRTQKRPPWPITIFIRAFMNGLRSACNQNMRNGKIDKVLRNYQ